MTRSRKTLGHEWEIAWDGGDRFGSAMVWQFGCAQALDYAGQEVPEEWEYSPGAMGTVDIYADRHDTFEARALYETVTEGQATWDDVVHFGNVLSRYVDQLELAGLTY